MQGGCLTSGSKLSDVTGPAGTVISHGIGTVFEVEALPVGLKVNGEPGIRRWWSGVATRTSSLCSTKENESKRLLQL